MTFVSYAQNFEDVLLWRALHDIDHGHYLDIGAQDPRLDSVSRAFYEAGWRGIHVEPTPFYADQLREARPDEIVIEAAVTDATGPIPFYELGGLSSGRKDVAKRHEESGHRPRKILMPTVSLDNLFGLFDSEIHWLKIDVEGMEADVLRSWGECPIRPWILVIESTYPNSERPTQHLRIEEVLSRGYKEVFFDGLSRFFLHQSHANLAERLNRPANVFDSYQITLQHFSTKDAGEEVSALQKAHEAREVQQSALLLDQLEQIRSSTIDLEDQRAAYSLLESRAATEIEEARARITGVETALAASLAQLEELSALQQKSAAELESLNRNLRAERDARIGLDAELAEIAKLTDPGLFSFSNPNQTLRSVPSGLAYAAVKSRLHLAAREGGLLSEHAERQYVVGLSARETEVTFLNDRISTLQAEISDTRRQLAESDNLHAALRERSEIAERENARMQFVVREQTLVTSLIHQLLAERRHRWNRIGQFLGLTKPSSARMALRAWVESSPAAVASPYILHQITETPMPAPSPIQEGNPYHRANSLAELLSWDDVEFIRCAYVTVLGRQPDPGGEAFYADQIRKGRSKMDVLWQLRRSNEAQRHDPGIAGFDKMLRRARRARMRLFGAIFRSLYREEGDSAEDRRQRAMANDLRLLVTSCDSQAKRLHGSVERLANRLQGFEDLVASLQHQVCSDDSNTQIAPKQRQLSDPIDMIFANNPEEVIDMLKSAINSSREVRAFHAGAE